MSIQTELTRLTNAKAAIQTAIEGKGVTVPSGTLLDGMAALIDSIEAGGGGEFYTGSFSYESDKTYPYLSLELTGGKFPEWVAIACKNNNYGTKKLKIGLYHNKGYGSSTNYVIQDIWLLYETTYLIKTDNSISTDRYTKVPLYGGITTIKCYAGDVYTWIAFGENKI